MERELALATEQDEREKMYAKLQEQKKRDEEQRDKYENFLLSPPKGGMCGCGGKSLPPMEPGFAMLADARSELGIEQAVVNMLTRLLGSTGGTQQNSRVKKLAAVEDRSATQRAGQVSLYELLLPDKHLVAIIGSGEGEMASFVQGFGKHGDSGAAMLPQSTPLGRESEGPLSGLLLSIGSPFWPYFIDLRSGDAEITVDSVNGLPTPQAPLFSMGERVGALLKQTAHGMAAAATEAAVFEVRRDRRERRARKQGSARERQSERRSESWHAGWSWRHEGER
eukprot:2148579-Pleurochrysis_carterae.AAC.1